MNILLLLIAFAAPARAAAPPYQGVTISTPTGTAVENVSGRVEVARSSVSASTPTIVLDGATGKVSAASVTASGYITAGGSVTASAFFGDGSHLAGILGSSVQAGSITGGPLNSGILPSTVAYTSVSNTFKSSQTVTAAGGILAASSVTASAFFGDGSHLLGVQTVMPAPVQDDFHSQTDGSRTNFLLSQVPSSVSTIMVFRDGVAISTYDWSFSAPQTVVMAKAPAANTSALFMRYWINTGNSPAIINAAGNNAFAGANTFASTTTFAGATSFVSTVTFASSTTFNTVPEFNAGVKFADGSTQTTAFQLYYASVSVSGGHNVDFYITASNFHDLNGSVAPNGITFRLVMTYLTDVRWAACGNGMSDVEAVVTEGSPSPGTTWTHGIYLSPPSGSHLIFTQFNSPVPSCGGPAIWAIMAYR